MTKQPVGSEEIAPVGVILVDPEVGNDPENREIEQSTERGQGLVEYALVLLLIAIVLIFMLTFIGAKLNTAFSNIGSGLGR